MGISYAQAEGLWIKAGGDPSVAPIAAAIVFPESGGNPSALNPTDNGGRQSSFGLWQISNGTHTPPDPNWSDPLTNAKLAVAKYKGAGNAFTPWGTYDSGAYKRYLQSGVTPDMSAGGAGGVTGVPDGGIQTVGNTSGVASPSDWLTGIGNVLAMFGNYGFIGITLVGGAVMMLVALLIIMRDSSNIAPAAGVLRMIGVSRVVRGL